MTTGTRRALAPVEDDTPADIPMEVIAEQVIRATRLKRGPSHETLHELLEAIVKHAPLRSRPSLRPSLRSRPAWRAWTGE